MTKYYLGIDVGGTKSHALISDELGNVIGFGSDGSGNYENVGWDGFRSVLHGITETALVSAGISCDKIAGAGFGIAGYDWPSERKPVLASISSLNLSCPVEAVNDTIIGLLAGATQGWGVVLGAGTSNNCRGRTKEGREGRVTGNGILFGEYGGAHEIVWKALHAVAQEWTLRGPETQLSNAFVDYAGAKDVADLLEGLQFGQYSINAQTAPLIFQAAENGDKIANDIILWASQELASLAIGVVRQLEFQKKEFEIVLVGSLFKGGSLLLEPMKEAIKKVASKALFLRLASPPVVGAVLLGMEQAGVDFSNARKNLIQATNDLLATEKK